MSGDDFDAVADEREDRFWPPALALLLGLAGALPFVGLMGMLLAHPEEQPGDRQMVASALTYYGIAILSFLGGIHWGLAMTEERGRQFLLSIAPPLFAWAAFLYGQRFGWLWLAIGFVLLFLADRNVSRRGWTASWYLALRLPPTLAAVASLVIAALFS